MPCSWWQLTACIAVFSQAKMEREQRQKAEGEAALLKGLLKQVRVPAALQ